MNVANSEFTDFGVAIWTDIDTVIRSCTMYVGWLGAVHVASGATTIESSVVFCIDGGNPITLESGNVSSSCSNIYTPNANAWDHAFLAGQRPGDPGSTNLGEDPLICSQSAHGGFIALHEDSPLWPENNVCSSLLGYHEDVGCGHIQETNCGGFFVPTKTIILGDYQGPVQVRTVPVCELKPRT